MNKALGLLGPAIITISSAAIFVESFSYNIRDRFWPQGISVLIVILCISLVAGQLRKETQSDKEIDKKDRKTTKGNRLVFISIFLIIAYLFMAEWLGYYLCSTILIFVLLFVLGERGKVVLTVLPIATMLIIYGVFHLFLRIPLPTGLIF